jgi:hypothetical protein
MKKTIVIVLALVAFVSAQAQIEKGAVLVGASSNLSFSSEKPKGGDAQSVFSIDGKAGYFFANNFAGGVNISFASTDGASSTGIGAFARYYIGGKFFLGAGFSAMSDKFEIDLGNGNETIKTKYNQIPLEAGFAAFITDNIAVEPSLNYAIISGDMEGSRLGINVGFSLYLNRGEK